MTITPKLEGSAQYDVTSMFIIKTHFLKNISHIACHSLLMVYTGICSNYAHLYVDSICFGFAFYIAP